MSQINSLVEEALGGIDRELASSLAQKQEKFDHWHGKIRESAKARQIEQKQLDELKRKSSERVETERRIKNLQQSADLLRARLQETRKTDLSTQVVVGDADADSGVDVSTYDTLFAEDFDPSTNGFSDQQVAFLSALPAPEVMARRIEIYEKFLAGVTEEVENLKAKNAILGQNYRRMVMACTNWTAEQVDEAAEGLTQCVKDLNDNPVPEDEALELLMQDRGQDW